MRTTGVPLLLTAALLAGCGAGKKAAKPNGEAAKPPTAVLADAKRAATTARSLHVSGNVESGKTPVTFDLSMNGSGATGSMTMSGLQFGLVRVGKFVYIKGSSAFLKRYAGGQAGFLQGKWLKVPATRGQFAPIAPLTSPKALFTAIVKNHGKLANDGTTTYKGQQVVAIRDTSDDSKLYVSATGTPYPVAIVGGTSGATGAIKFNRWNAPVSVDVPKGAIDLSSLGAG